MYSKWYIYTVKTGQDAWRKWDYVSFARPLKQDINLSGGILLRLKYFGE